MIREIDAACAACKGSLHPFGKRLNYTYMRCGACGTIQLYPMPDRLEIARCYEEEYAASQHYEADPELCIKSARTYYQSIVQVLKDYEVRGPVLDYGAGWGGLCDMLIQNGFLCTGMEISRDMVASCRGRGLPVEQGDIESLEGRVFSALVLCTVFEHLIDPDHWLAQASRLLGENGLLVTLQPTSGFADFMGRILRLGNLRAPLPRLQQVFCPPWHTAFFSFTGMKAIANRNGFELLEIRPAPQGRQNGITGFAQSILGGMNRAGWRLMEKNWPLVIAHLFVLKKNRLARSD